MRKIESLPKLYKSMEHKTSAVENTSEKKHPLKYMFIQSICVVIIYKTVGVWEFYL